MYPSQEVTRMPENFLLSCIHLAKVTMARTSDIYYQGTNPNKFRSDMSNSLVDFF